MEDHQYDDRDFSVQDVNDIYLLIYTEREPNEDFKQISRYSLSKRVTRTRAINVR